MTAKPEEKGPRAQSPDAAPDATVGHGDDCQREATPCVWVGGDRRPAWVNPGEVYCTAHDHVTHMRNISRSAPCRLTPIPVIAPARMPTPKGSDHA